MDSNFKKWTRVFQQKIAEKAIEDNWTIECDDTIVCHAPQSGWQQYTTQAVAKFRCSKCKTLWADPYVEVLFHTNLVPELKTGTVKVKREAQECERCAQHKKETPQFKAKISERLLTRLVLEIVKTYYNTPGVVRINVLHTAEDWGTVFMTKVEEINKKDSWNLEFSDSIVPNSPESRWCQYIKKTSGSFTCFLCNRCWSSRQVIVMFHFHLRRGLGQGTVKVRCFRQKCSRCRNGPMQDVGIHTDDLDFLLDKLLEKLRIKCYQEAPDRRVYMPNHVEEVEPHHKANCEACIYDVCSFNTQQEK